MQGDADTAAGAHRRALELHILRHGRENATRQIGRLLAARNIGLQNGEFIAAEACQGVFLADRLLEARGDELQETIASRVAEHVVDALEAVEIEKMQRENMIAAPGT